MATKWWAVLVVVLLAATITALDGLYAWIGTPIRHLGLLAWVVFGSTFAVGRRVGIDDMARRVGAIERGDIESARESLDVAADPPDPAPPHRGR